MSKLELKFIYAFPLDRDRRSLAEKKGVTDYPSLEDVRETKKHWQELWNKIDSEKRILDKIQDITKTLPERSLECFVIGGLMKPMSTPFIIPVLSRDGKRSDEELIDTVIHELLHIFVVQSVNYFKYVREKYNTESVLTQNHIIIYAMLEKIYLELFDSKPLDYLRKDMPDDYQRAIDIVKESGREIIIEEYYNNMD